ncbi:hypothetical protein ABT009_46335 [Streptomyces sp. NPDC002896]|uniref:hypothetical protein n=1 Tax=Streptomyces sp. NPDC002896 TaxID=3154438 RepID=UPI00332074D1
MASQERIRAAVVFGGQSTEHSVSCVSRASVLANLDPARFEVSRSASHRRARGCSARPTRRRWRSTAGPCRPSPPAPRYEDDYDGELRYDVAPLPLLAALARTSSCTWAPRARSTPRPWVWAGWSRRRRSSP